MKLGHIGSVAALLLGSVTPALPQDGAYFRQQLKVPLIITPTEETPAPIAPVLGNVTAPEGTEGEPWTLSPVLLEGDDVSWTLSGLYPQWISIDPHSGSLSGTAAMGDYGPFSLIASNDAGSDTLELSFSVYDQLSTESIDIEAAAGETVSETIAAIGGKPPYNFSWVSTEQERPAWLNLSSAGLLSGTTADGEWSDLEILVSDISGREASAFIDILIKSMASAWNLWGVGYHDSVEHDDSVPMSAGVVFLDHFDEIFTSISMGSAACGIYAGDAYCWGNTALAIGQEVPGTAIHKIPTISNVEKIAIGNAHACALQQNGDVYCWGKNASYQTRSSSTSDTTAPYRAYSSGDAIDIAVGYTTSCIVTSGGQAKCWGGHSFNGYGTNVDSRSISTIGNISDAKTIAAANFGACVTTTFARVKCWGYANYNAATSHTASANLLSLTQVAAVYGGGPVLFAVKQNGDVYSWGASSSYYMLGDGTTGARHDPTLVSHLKNASKISVNTMSGCALIGSDVKCWGYGAAEESSRIPGLSGTIVYPTLVPELTGSSTISQAYNGGYAR